MMTTLPFPLFFIPRQEREREREREEDGILSHCPVFYFFKGFISLSADGGGWYVGSAKENAQFGTK